MISILKKDAIIQIIDSKYIKYLIFMLCFLAVMTIQIVYLFPLDQPLYGHDSAYHYLRTEALKQRIENFDLFNGGVDYLFNNGAGYASSLAYPDILLFIPALLRVFGLGIGTSMSVFLIICNALCYISMFICVRKISGSGTCGTIAAVIFSLSQYRIDNLFSRFALGEIQSYIFWPIIIYGLYDLIFDNFKKPYVLGLGIGCMILTHTISAALALGLCLIMLLIFIKRIIKSPFPGKLFAKLALTAAAVIALTAFYWIPLLEFMSSCELTVSHSIEYTSDYTVEFFNLFRDIPLYLAEAGMGILIFALLIPRIMLCKNSPICKSMQLDENDKKRHKLLIAADAFMILGLIVCFISTKAAPWKILGIVFDFMQFSWRFFALAAALISVAAAVYIFITSRYANAEKAAMIVVTVLAVLSCGAHLKTIAPFHTDKLPDDHYLSSEYTFDIGYGEWLPWTARLNFEEVQNLSDKLILENDEEISFNRNNGKLSFKAPEDGNTYADIPYIWYKGYKATDESGHELETYMNNKGMLRVYISNAKGSVTVEYKLTVIKIVSYIISILTVIILAAIFILKKIQKNP